jgi:type I restriction enzyme, S subunit
MKHWPIKPLGELLKVQNGFAFKSELFNEDGRGLPIIRIRDLERGFSETFYDGEHDAAFEVKNGDFLIGMDGEFRCYRWWGGKALLNQRVCRLQGFSPNLNAGYVFYGINDHLREIENNTAFVTVKHLSSKQIASIEMRVPPLAEQERIVKLLEEADGLRKLRAQVDRRTAALVPALFHELFGDPASRNWMECGFGDTKVMEIIDGDRGTNYPKKTNFRESGFCLFLTTSNVRNGVFDFTKCDFITSDKDSALRKGKLARGDVILTTRGTLGNSAHYDTAVPYENVRINSGMVILRTNPELLLPEYLLVILNSDGFTSQVEMMTSGSAQPQLPINRLSHIKFALPPLPLQMEFAQRVAEIREMEMVQAKSRERLEALFQSMLHRAFNGELT